MFRNSSNGIEEYTTSVIGFINKCIYDVVPSETVPESMEYMYIYKAGLPGHVLKSMHGPTGKCLH
jgi:hypothetical protein